MDNYFKGKNVEEELERNKIPISNIPDNFLWMQVICNKNKHTIQFYNIYLSIFLYLK